MAKKSKDDGRMVAMNDAPRQSNKETVLHQLLDNFVTASDKEQRRWAKFRDQAVRYLYDDQLHDVTIPENWSRVQMNQIYPAIMQELALHVQRLRNSDIKVKPIGSNYKDEDADIIEGRMRWHYKKNIDIPGLMMKHMFEGKLSGWYANRPRWDDEALWDEDDGEFTGRATAELIPPGQFVVDPECGHDLTQARYMGTFRRAEVDELVQQWPDKKDEILMAARGEHERERQRATDGYFAEVEDDDQTVNADGSYAVADGEPADTSDVDQMKGGELADLLLGRRDDMPATIHRPEREQPRFVHVLEIFIRDYERKDDKPLYPYGRMIQRVGSGEKAVILNDRPESKAGADDDPQRWWMPMWPFVVGVNQPLPHNTWRGLDGVLMLAGPQDAVNDNARHMEMYVRLYGDPTTMVEEGAEITSTRDDTTSTFKRTAGAIWRFAKGALTKGKVQQREPPQMSNALFSIMGLFSQDLRDRSGVHEVAQGKETPGQATATEVMQLQTNSRLRVAAQTWYADRFIMELLTRVMQIEMRHLSDGENVDTIDATGKEATQEITDSAMELEYEIELQVITALPWDNERAQNKALALHESLGFPTTTAAMLLENFKDDISGLNPDEILTRIRNLTDQQQQIQQLEGQVQQLEGQVQEAQQQAEANEPEEVDLSKELPEGL